MTWNIWGVGGVSPIFLNKSLGGADEAVISPGISMMDEVKVYLLMKTGQISYSNATSIGLIMNLEL